MTVQPRGGKSLRGLKSGGAHRLRVPEFFALVDALAGKEREVGESLRQVERLKGVEPCREGNYDYLVRFDADSFGVVDDFLQTHVRQLRHVKGVEVILDWDDHGAQVREARDRMLARARPAAAATSTAPAPAPSARRAVVLLSGGLDSCVAAAMAKAQGLELHAVSFDYGQRHKRELDSARAVAQALGARSHNVLHIPTLGGSALTEASIAVPTGRSGAQMGADIPVTYVPARNAVFLSFAVGLAEVKDADSIFIGANALDYSGYPDCRPEFFAAFQEAARLGTKRGVQGRPVRIVVPLQSMTKADIVREALKLQAPIELTWSCYQGGPKACGACDSCQLRLKGFREAGARDPIAYA
jgi:7-cyano-7-deazaguanine synthase